MERPGGVSIAWDRFGRLAGRPAVVLHGGPGSGRSPSARRLFDPARWCVTQFDQRGCGDSRPHAADDPAILGLVDIDRMVGDIEALRATLGIERWLVYGGSWGATLALAYAAAHADRVAALVLGPVTMTTRGEVDYATRIAGRANAAAWAELCAAVPEVTVDLDDPDAGFTLLGALKARLSDPATAQAAAQAWAAWEITLAGADHPRWRDPRFQLAFARLVVHAWSACAWLPDGALLDAAARFDHLPRAIEGALVHADDDRSATAAAADALAGVWRGALRVRLDGTAHALTDGGLSAALGRAIADFAARDDLFEP